MRGLGLVLYEHDFVRDHVHWSGDTESVIGWSIGELGHAGEGWLSRVHPDDLESIRVAVESASGHPYCMVEYRFRHKAGHYIWISDRGIVERGVNGGIKRISGVFSNIDGHKAAQEKLERSEAAHRAILASALDCIIAMDLDDRIIEFNPAAERTFGYSREEAVGKELASLIIPPDLREQHRKGVARLLKTGQSTLLGKRVELRAMRSNGEQFPVELTITRSGSAETPLFTGFVRDLTDQKRAEAQLTASRQQLEALVSDIDGIVWEADPVTFKFQFVSQQAETLLGYPVDQWLNEPDFWRRHIHPDDREMAMSICRRSVSELRNHEFEYRMMAADGKAVWLEDKVSIQVKEGRAASIRGIMVDITTLKEAEQGLRETAQRHRTQRDTIISLTASRFLQSGEVTAALHEISESISQTLGVGRVSIWRLNAAQTLISCVNLFEAEPRRHSSGMEFATAMHPGFFQKLSSNIVITSEDALNDSQFGTLIEKYIKPLGIRSKLDVPVHVGGAVGGALCVEHTGPPRVWAPDEQSFAVSMANIVSLVFEQEDRRGMAELLRQSQKMEAIGQLAGGVAHDFNNILSAMLMQAEMAASYEGLPPEVQEFLNDIQMSAERAASLTRQLLAFSRRQVMQVRLVDLNEVVTQLMRMLQRIVGEDIRMQLHLHSTPLFTKADPGMLDQVLMNLAVNARDAMLNGGQLVIETSQTTIVDGQADLELAAGRYNILSVRDTGCGIPPESLSRIFEPFFTTKEPGKGTGLGLATVFGIVKQHQGTVKVRSEVGAGARFDIFLPTAEGGTHPQAGKAKGEKPRGGTETILVVEDEPSVRLLTRTVLERNGYRVREAANGVEASRVWDESAGRVDLLITDMVMPEGMTGRELAARLLERAPSLKVLFTSGYSSDLAGRELKLQEGQNFLQKPFPPNQLLETVRRLLDG